MNNCLWIMMLLASCGCNNGVTTIPSTFNPCVPNCQPMPQPVNPCMPQCEQPVTIPSCQNNMGSEWIIWMMLLMSMNKPVQQNCARTNNFCC